MKCKPQVKILYHHLKKSSFIIFQIRRPRNFLKQGNTFSSYKNQNVYNVLIGVLPTGTLAFVSKPFEGCISDNKLLEDSGMLDWSEHGDRWLADRGFTCHHLFAERQCHLITPPFKNRENDTMSKLDIYRAQVMAKARIHIGTCTRLNSNSL